MDSVHLDLCYVDSLFLCSYCILEGVLTRLRTILRFWLRVVTQNILILEILELFGNLFCLC